MARVRFGDVVKEVKINIDRKTDDHEFFIAGEHMESENIHITKRGRFADSDVGPAFIRLFKPGQILYGSRRTYLKKVAVEKLDAVLMDKLEDAKSYQYSFSTRKRIYNWEDLNVTVWI